MTRRTLSLVSVMLLGGCIMAALISAQESKESASKLAKEVRIEVRKGNFAVSFRPPADWKESKNRLVLSAKSFSAPVQKGYTPRLLVTFHRSGTALKIYVPELKLKLGKLLDELRLEKDEYTEVGGCEAWQAVTFYSHGNLQLRSLQTVLAAKGWKLSFTFTAEASAFGKLEKRFRDSTASFRLREKPPAGKGGSEGETEEE